MKSKTKVGSHKRSKEDLRDFIKKLELQALETAEERMPLYLEVGLKDAKLILDVGCGPGMVTRDIAHLTKGKVIAIDDSEDMIKVAKDVLKAYKNVELRVGNAENLPFDKNMFDIVTCNLVLMWADDPQKVYTLVSQGYMEKFGMVWLKPFGFNGPLTETACGGKEVGSLAAPIATKDVLRKFPVLDRVINKLGGSVDNDRLEELRKKTENQNVREAVRAFLKSQKMI